LENIRKKVLVDECNRPIAVQIDYDDWVRIEDMLDTMESGTPGVVDLSPFHGVIKLREDPLEYQARMRSEWDEPSP